MAKTQRVAEITTICFSTPREKNIELLSSPNIPCNAPIPMRVNV